MNYFQCFTFKLIYTDIKVSKRAIPSWFVGTKYKNFNQITAFTALLVFRYSEINFQLISDGVFNCGGNLRKSKSVFTFNSLFL